MKSLYDVLNLPDPSALQSVPEQQASITDCLDLEDPTEFCKRIICSREWRQYIMNGIVLRDLPSAIACRIMDHAMGKPAEHVEHTGKNGAPIITEVRRVIVCSQASEFDDEQPVKQVTH